MIQIPNPEKKQREQVRRGKCFRCGDFGLLRKGVWNDPYTDTDGEGWLCDPCFEKTQPIRAKYSYEAVQGRQTDLSKEFHPVPKPAPKKKKKGGEE